MTDGLSHPRDPDFLSLWGSLMLYQLPGDSPVRPGLKTIGTLRKKHLYVPCQLILHLLESPVPSRPGTLHS